MSAGAERVLSTWRGAPIGQDDPRAALEDPQRVDFAVLRANDRFWRFEARLWLSLPSIGPGARKTTTAVSIDRAALRSLRDMIDEALVE